MRLWHKDLIPVLLRQQLLSQWRECCCIARNIAVNGTPNHLLVNKVLDYNISHFSNYCVCIITEMTNRGYKVSDKSKFDLITNISKGSKYFKETNDNGITKQQLFSDWHNDRYFWQCYYNLQEKYDCGGISYEEWAKIETVAYHKKN